MRAIWVVIGEPPRFTSRIASSNSATPAPGLAKLVLPELAGPATRNASAAPGEQVSADFTVTNAGATALEAYAESQAASGGTALYDDVALPPATGTMTPYLGQRSKYKIRADGDHYYQMGVNDRPMEEMWRRLPQ